MEKNIVWLASYPKSGNTWCRAFLSALLYPQETFHINTMKLNLYYADNNLYEPITGINISELFDHEIDLLKPEVFRHLSEEAEELLWIKIHEKLKPVSPTALNIPVANSYKVLYFLRNPLDIAISFAFHDNIEVNNIIHRMSKNFTMGKSKNREFYNVIEELGSWSEHVLSWVDNDRIDLHIVRYEDLKKHTEQTFTQAIEFLGLAFSKEEIKSAIEKTSFSVMSKQENETVFKEKAQASKKFFRSGQLGQWQKLLAPSQVSKIVRDHYEVMDRFGYLAAIRL